MENQEQNETYRQKLQDQLDDWRAEIDRLKERARSATASGRLIYQENIDRLEMKLDEGFEKLKELQGPGAEAWEVVKTGADSVWDTMKATFAEVKEKLREKEAGDSKQ